MLLTSCAKAPRNFIPHLFRSPRVSCLVRTGKSLLFLLAAWLLSMEPLSAESAALAKRPTSDPYKGDLSIFEDPNRAANLQIDRVMDLLRIGKGSRVADIGAGSGWFTVRAAAASERKASSTRSRSIRITFAACSVVPEGETTKRADRSGPAGRSPLRACESGCGSLAQDLSRNRRNRSRCCARCASDARRRATWHDRQERDRKRSRIKCRGRDQGSRGKQVSRSSSSTIS